MQPRQGRYTYESAEEAQAQIDLEIANTQPGWARHLWGEDPKFEVRLVECRPEDFSPKLVFVDD